MSQTVLRKKVADIWLTDKAITYIYKRTSGFTKAQILDELKMSLGTAFANTIQKVYQWIIKYVPKATGNLQAHLIETMTNSPGFKRLQDSIGAKTTGTTAALPKRITLMIGLDPANPVPYAKYVNKMSTGQVQHSGMVTVGPRGGHHGDVAWVNRGGYYGKIRLYDPSAIGSYAGLLRMYAREQMKNELKKAINQFITFDRSSLRGAGVGV